MIPLIRNYDFLALIKVNNPPQFSFKTPNDDKVNWMHLKLKNGQLFGFVYLIIDENPNYGIPFKAYISFNARDIIRNLININKEYEILRGMSPIGSLTIIEDLWSNYTSRFYLNKETESIIVATENGDTIFELDKGILCSYNNLQYSKTHKIGETMPIKIKKIDEIKMQIYCEPIM